MSAGAIPLLSQWLYRSNRCSRIIKGCSFSAAAAAASKDLSNNKKANVVVVGGGIIGTSVAYHLALLGIQNVVLLEKHELTSGTTWHAAGLVSTFGSLSGTSTEMRIYSKKLYRDVLPEVTGMDTGFKEIGFLQLANDDDHLHYYQRVAAFNQHCGVQNIQQLTPVECKDLFPLLDTNDLMGGFWSPTDGRVNPVDATRVMAKAAQQLGVQIFQGVTVQEVLQQPSATSRLPQVSGVITDAGQVMECNTVVNCCGMWARQFGQQHDVTIPNQAVEHYYLITDAMPQVDPDWPVVEDASRCVYIRPEAGGLMLGLFERHGAVWNPNEIPHDFNYGEIIPDWDRMEPYLERAMQRVLYQIHYKWEPSSYSAVQSLLLRINNLSLDLLHF